jgi:hypothetical protein
MTKPSDDNQINWDPKIFFDPTNVNDIFATHGIPIPTYGNYGGPGYTAGTLGGTASVPADPLPVDPLDQLFYQHDLAIQQAQANPDPTAAAAAIVVASVQLVLSMNALPLINPSDQSYDPAAQLYEGLGTLAVVSQLIAPGWDLIPQLFQDGQSIQNAIISATQHAVVNFEEGLAAIPGEAGSLHGALHVFEQKFADMLPFDLL